MLQNQWVRKYRPKTIDEYVFQDDLLKDKVNEYIETKNIPHLLLYGAAGTGKTSLAKLLIDHMDVDQDCDVLEINASDTNSVDDIRDTVTMFCKTAPMGSFKIVHLKECDYLSHNAQGALREVMEEYDFQTRFVLTCNHINRVKDAIRSRCVQYPFKNPNKDEVAERLATILMDEGVEPNEFLFDYIDRSYPDIRNIIMNLESGVVDGVLVDPSKLSTGNKEHLTSLLTCLEEGDWTTAREVTCSNVAPEEWEEVYRFLYENIGTCKAFSDPQKHEQAIVTIAEYLYKHSIVADPEINAAAMFIMLGQI